MKPTEVAKAVNDSLMSKLNKGVVFSSFINAVKFKTSFIEYCLEQVKAIEVFLPYLPRCTSLPRYGILQEEQSGRNALMLVIR